MSKSTNKKQMEILLSTMELYPEIARGWFKGSREELNRVWTSLTEELNALGPPSKSIAEWKKVWCDQKKYVRHKAAQNLKFSRATGGGPNMEQKFSPFEETIYNLIGMKESVEGVATSFGLGVSTSKNPTPESIQPALLESVFDDDIILEKSLRENEKDTPQKPPKKKFKSDFQQDLCKNTFSSDILSEEISIQKKMLEEMKEQQVNTKKIYRAIDRLYDLKKAELEEQKRHNLAMEKLRLREVEDKIEKNRRLLELEDLKHLS